MVIPAPEPAGSLTHRVTHELRGLEPGAVYEAIVQAKNRYGWNEVRVYFSLQTLPGVRGKRPVKIRCWAGLEDEDLVLLVF